MANSRVQQTRITEVPPPGRPHLSSWYTQGASDGFGDRLLMFDNATTGPLELLRVRPDFSFVPSFESRLRARVERLSGFTHRSVAATRAIDHLDSGEGLTVISAHVPGTRLSELFPASRLHAGMHPAAARWVMGELVSALAALHRQYPGVAHGAVAPERIVITADRHVVLTDYVFGDALAGMRLPAERLWTEFGIVGGRTGDAPRLDQRGDVTQVALVGLSLIIGRRVTPDDFTRQLERLLDDLTAACERQAPGTGVGMRAWIERALSDEGFPSAVEAEAALTLLTGPAAIPEAAAPAVDDASVGRALVATPAARASDAIDPDESGMLHADTRASQFRLFPWLAGALAIIGVVQGAIIAGLVFRTAPQPAPVQVATPQVAPTALPDVPPPAPVDAEPAPAQPAAPPPRAGAVIASSEAAASQPDIQAAPLAQYGQVRIDLPFGVQVFEGTRALGSSTGGPIRLAAGAHELTLVNERFGVRVTVTAHVAPGGVQPLSVTVPDGRLSANAQPWAQVSVDGTVLGETPLANLPIAPGEHEVIFQNPQMGERRQAIVVRAGELTRASETFQP
jgi:hypothetical protein